MAKRKKAVKGTQNSSAILKTYTQGASLAELREKYGIAAKGQLASAVLDALIESGKMPALKRGAAAKKLPSEFTLTVNTRGTIVLPKDAVVGAFRFSPGQKFVARRRGRKIVLTLGA